MKLNFPLIGAMVIKTELANFCSMFAMAINSGLGVINALDMGSGVVKNIVLHDTIDAVKVGVLNGVELSDALEATGRFPDMIVRMVRIGMQTGELGSMMDRVSNFYDEEAKEAISAIVSTIKPVMIGIIGGFISWIVIGVFGPMYQNIGHMLDKVN